MLSRTTEFAKGQSTLFFTVRLVLYDYLFLVGGLFEFTDLYVYRNERRAEE